MERQLYEAFVSLCTAHRIQIEVTSHEKADFKSLQLIGPIEHREQLLTPDI